MFTHIKSKYFIEENRLDLGSDKLYIPKVILSNKNKNRTFDLQKSRDDRLNNSSEQELKFCEYYYYSHIIKEVPFPIKDLILWNKLLDPYGISLTDQERTRNIHQVDFLFTEISLVVELDSKYHAHRKMLDQARDQYLMLEYGLKVLRFENNMEFMDHIDEINRLLSIPNPVNIINLQDLSDEYFDRKFKLITTSFDIIISRRTDWNIPRLKGIIVTKEDLQDLMITNSEFDKINEWSSKYCGKELIRINSDECSENIIREYRNGELNPDSELYQTLKNLGY